MAANCTISPTAAIAACDAIVDLLDGGTAAGYIEIRTGAPPATCDAASTGTLLATLTCSNPAFGGAADDNTGGKATASAITADTSADATGTAGYFRGFDSAANCVIQGTVGTSGEDLNLNSVAIQAAAEVSITAWTVTVPET